MTNVLNLIAGGLAKDANFRRMVREERLNSQVARVIYEARTADGLTQRQLAELVGTTQPVIARLEDADYDGHSLTMLRRIAEALDRKVEVRLEPKSKRRPLQRT